MENFSQDEPDLKWYSLAIIGRGKSAVIYSVRNIVTREVQLWKCIHDGGRIDSSEYTILNMLKGHDNIQKVFHGDETYHVIVLKFANGGDLHSYGLDHFGALRQSMPEILLWHFLKSMAAALAYCQAGWKDGEPFVAKEGWRAVIHGDLMEGNILLHWRHSAMFPQFILTDFGDAKLLDEMPRPRYDYMLQALRTRDPTASHLKRDLESLGSSLQSMLVLPLFGGDSKKMGEEHNVDLAFDFARQQNKMAFSPELAEWVDKLAYNRKTRKGTKFANALEFAKELVPLATRKIAELSESAAELPGRRYLPLNGQDCSTTFSVPLEKDVLAFIDYYVEDAFEGKPGLSERHKKGDLDPDFETYRAAHIRELRKNPRPRFVMPRFEESESDHSNVESNASASKATHCLASDEGSKIEAGSRGDKKVKEVDRSEGQKEEASSGKAELNAEQGNSTDTNQPAGVADEAEPTIETERGEVVPTEKGSGKRKHGFDDPQSTESEDATPKKRARTTSAMASAASKAATTIKEA